MPTPSKPLRLWPGVAAAALLLLARFGLPLVAPAVANAVLIGLAGGLAIMVWWLFFSRAPWVERLGAVALMILAVLATSRLVHQSIAGGAMGMLLYILAIPVLSLALVAWALAARRLAGGPRWAALLVSIILACGLLALIRTSGVRGDDFELHWRWTDTPEERLLAQAGQEPPDVVAPRAPLDSAEGGRTDIDRFEPFDAAQGEPLDAAGHKPVDAARGVPSSPAPVELSDPARGERLGAGPDKPLDSARGAPLDSAQGEPLDAAGGESATPAPTARVSASAVPATARPAVYWPGFRGPNRNSIVTGVRINTDWTAAPPVELWRRRVGPGWSSFAVEGDRIYTQEQRGDDEIVACYNATTGQPVWWHRDTARFWESNGGPGPRATPTVANGRVYSVGATGIVNALDARDGAVVWSRDAATDAGKNVPYWGISASPLVTDDLVIVAASGRLVAYDLATGTPRWLGPDGGVSYSSPHLVTIDGVAQVLLLRDGGATSVAVADGARLWEHSWGGGAIVQPAMTTEGDVLISTNAMSGGNGIRRIGVARGAGGWSVEERWTSTGLKPYFNDFVVHEGHAYGFDGRILSCVDLEDGTRKWKGGRYGHGQLVLLPDQDLLLVLSEDGELALIRAAADKFTELARVPALGGKTWNHPALVGDLLLVRNGEEMAAFRLSGDGR